MFPQQIGGARVTQAIVQNFGEKKPFWAESWWKRCSEGRSKYRKKTNWVEGGAGGWGGEKSGAGGESWGERTVVLAGVLLGVAGGAKASG